MVRPLDGAGSRRLIAATACLLAEPRSASAQDSAAGERAPVASWLPLYTDRGLARLENENRLPQLCIDVDPVEPTRFTRAELIDEDGHLVIRPKYMKGC